MAQDFQYTLYTCIKRLNWHGNGRSRADSKDTVIFRYCFEHGLALSKSNNRPEFLAFFFPSFLNAFETHPTLWRNKKPQQKLTK